MLILSLDSAGSSCGACVWKDGKTLAAAEETMERGQDRRLMPLVIETMGKSNADFSLLDRIAITRGPGSFTGLRIGLAAARGIGLAAGKSVIGIDRFSIYREQVKEPDKNLLVIINSKRQELYCRFYPMQNTVTEPNMMTPDEIETFLDQNPNTVVAGDQPVPGIENFIRASEPETVTCAALAAQVAVNDRQFLPRPLYIRAPDVTIKAI